MYPPRLLLIEDDAGLAIALQTVLEAEEYRVTHRARGDEGLAIAEQEEFDTVLTDLRLPGIGGMELVRRIHAIRPTLPILLMTAHGTTETAIEAIKFGAFDYLLKPFEMEELLDLIARAVSSSRIAAEAVSIGEDASGRDALVGSSRAMQGIYKEIGRLAAKPITVLIRGETGTGKELVARALYQHSERSRAPFIAVNCAAIPETLLESELFGHERGAFTGAVERRIGRFEQANGGTLFLDEIGEMGASTQAKLLRVLQERVIQRLGGRETVPVDVRILAATHVPLEEAIAHRQFREDLFYRLNQATLVIPPLRERPEDLPELLRYFAKRQSAQMGFRVPSILPGAVSLFTSHPWPGNVRELENSVRLAILRSRGFPIDEALAREVITGTPAASGAPPQSVSQLVAQELANARRDESLPAYGRVMEVVERELMVQAMSLAGGNQSRAARWLGVSRVTLREKLRFLGVGASDSGNRE